ALIRKAIAAAQGKGSDIWIPSTPGIHARWGDLHVVREELREGGFSLFVLEEGGKFIRDLPFPKRPAFFLSDHKDFSPGERELLEDLPKVSLGPRSLQAQTCIALVHNELDLREAGWANV
ncbi:TPA: hypothetical protein EYP38_02250, partial [Candidatus Micrarchaeota archaeon]|nr:hypothetical protein [Candidatus Micrarchaeota archaeon]